MLIGYLVGVFIGITIASQLVRLFPIKRITSVPHTYCEAKDVL